MLLKEIDEYINNKIHKNENLIIFTYYELRIKCNLSKEDMNLFLTNAKIKLENNNYNIYEPGDIYIFNDKSGIVKDNELLIAIKNRKD